MGHRAFIFSGSGQVIVFGEDVIVAGCGRHVRQSHCAEIQMYSNLLSAKKDVIQASRPYDELKTKVIGLAKVRSQIRLPLQVTNYHEEWPKFQCDQAEFGLRRILQRHHAMLDRQTMMSLEYCERSTRHL